MYALKFIKKIVRRFVNNKLIFISTIIISENRTTMSNNQNIEIFDSRLNDKQLLVVTNELRSSTPLTINVCSPKFYTVCHMAHIRKYMSLDIIRRVLEDYFHIPTILTMNILDLNGRIIQATKDTSEKNNLSNNDFLSFSLYWEKLFFETMTELNVQPPNIVNKTSDYIQEIFSFIEQIENKGLTFEHEGSVYFYGSKYLNEDNYTPDPNNKLNFIFLEKPADNEPQWKSKWGMIRPRYHKVDDGPVNIIFESQSEEYRINSSLNIPIFMNVGPVMINGCKMTRSKNNFVTADEALQYYNANEIRMLFLLHEWNKPVEYNDVSMANAKNYMTYFINFFIQIENVIIASNENTKYTDHEYDLQMLLSQTKFLVHKHFCDNFNTSKVITELYTLGDKAYLYTKLNKKKCPLVLTSIFNYIKHILEVLGLTFNERSSFGAEMLIKTHMELQSVIPNIPKEYRSSLFKIADKIRDKYLPALNVSVEN